MAFSFEFLCLGLAQNKETQLTMTGPFDKLGRFINIGWVGVFDYSIIRTAAVRQIVSASSKGNNAA